MTYSAPVNASGKLIPCIAILCVLPLGQAGFVDKTLAEQIFTNQFDAPIYPIATTPYCTKRHTR